MNMISGSTGLSGAADSAFVLQKNARSANAASLHCTGRDIPDRTLKLEFGEEDHVWKLLEDSKTRSGASRISTLQIENLLSELLQKEPEISVPAKALLEKIDPVGSEGWTPNSFSHQIRKSVDTLRKNGILVSFPKEQRRTADLPEKGRWCRFSHCGKKSNARALCPDPAGAAKPHVAPTCGQRGENAKRPVVGQIWILLCRSFPRSTHLCGSCRREVRRNRNRPFRKLQERHTNTRLHEKCHAICVADEQNPLGWSAARQRHWLPAGNRVR